MRTLLAGLRRSRLTCLAGGSLLILGCTTAVTSSPEGTTTTYVENSGVRVYAPRSARAQKVVFDTGDEQMIHARDTPLRRFFDRHAADFNGGEALARAKTTILEDIVHRLKNREYVRNMIREVIAQHPEAIAEPAEANVGGAKADKADKERKARDRARAARLLEESLYQALLEANYPGMRDSDIAELLREFENKPVGAGSSVARHQERSEIWERTTNGDKPDAVEDLLRDLRHAIRGRTYFKQIIDEASAKRLDVFKKPSSATEPRKAAVSAAKAFLGKLDEGYDGHLSLPALEAWAESRVGKGFKKWGSGTEGFASELREVLRSASDNRITATEAFLAKRPTVLEPIFVGGDTAKSANEKIKKAYVSATLAEVKLKDEAEQLAKAGGEAQATAKASRKADEKLASETKKLGEAIQEVRTQLAEAKRSSASLLRSGGFFVRYRSSNDALEGKLAAGSVLRASIAKITSQDAAKRREFENQLVDLESQVSELKTQQAAVLRELRQTQAAFEAVLADSVEVEAKAHYPKLAGPVRNLVAQIEVLSRAIERKVVPQDRIETQSKSLREDVLGFLNSGSINPALKTEFEKAWVKLTLKSHFSLAKAVLSYLRAIEGNLSSLHGAEEDETELEVILGIRNEIDVVLGEVESARESAAEDRAAAEKAATRFVSTLQEPLETANLGMEPPYRQDVEAVISGVKKIIDETLAKHIDEARAFPKDLTGLTSVLESAFTPPLDTSLTRSTLAKSLEATFGDYADVLLDKDSLLEAFFRSGRIDFISKQGPEITLEKVREHMELEAKGKGAEGESSGSVKSALEAVEAAFNDVKVLGELKSAAAREEVVHAFRVELYHAFRDRIDEIVKSEQEVDYDYWWLTFHPKAVPLGPTVMEGQSVVEISFPERLIPKEQYHRWLQDHVRNRALLGVRSRGSSVGPVTTSELRSRVASDTLSGFLTVLRASELASRHPEVLEQVVSMLSELTRERDNGDAPPYMRVRRELGTLVERWEAAGALSSEDEEALSGGGETPTVADIEFGSLDNAIMTLREAAKTRRALVLGEVKAIRADSPSDQFVAATAVLRFLDRDSSVVEEASVEVVVEDLEDALEAGERARRNKLGGKAAISLRLRVANEQLGRVLSRLELALQKSLDDLKAQILGLKARLAKEEQRAAGDLTKARSFVVGSREEGASFQKAYEELAKARQEVRKGLAAHDQSQRSAWAKLGVLVERALVEVRRQRISTLLRVEESKWDRNEVASLLAAEPFSVAHVLLALRSAVEQELPLPSKAELYLNAYFGGIDRFKGVGANTYLSPYATTEERFQLNDFLQRAGVTPESRDLLRRRLTRLNLSLGEKQPPQVLLARFGALPEQLRKAVSKELLRGIRYREGVARIEALRNLELWFLEAELRESQAELYRLVVHGFYTSYPATPDPASIRDHYLSKESNLRSLIYLWLREEWQSGHDDRALGEHASGQLEERLRGRVVRFLDPIPFTRDVRRYLVRELSDPDRQSMYHWLGAIVRSSRAMDQLQRSLLKHVYKSLWIALGELSESRRRPTTFVGIDRATQYESFLHWGRPKLQSGIQIMDLLPASRDDLVGISINEGGVVARAAAQGEGAAAYDINEMALLQRTARQAGKSLSQVGPGVAAVTTASGGGQDFSQDLSHLKSFNESLGYDLGASGRGSIYARARAAMAYARRSEYLDAVITAAGRGDNFAKWVIRKGDLRSDLAGTDAEKLVAAAHNGYPNGDQPFHLLVKIPKTAVHTDWRGRRYVLFNSAYVATSRVPLETHGGWLGWLTKGFSYLLHPPLVAQEESWVVGTVYPFKWDVSTFEAQQDLLRKNNSLGGRIYLDSSDKIRYSAVKRKIEAEAGFVKATRALQSQHLGEVMKQIESEASAEHKAARERIKAGATTNSK